MENLVLNNLGPRIKTLALAVLGLVISVAATVAQEINIPDPGLETAIREALRMPNGPLSAQDLLGLINLDATSRNVSSVEGLEAARNLQGLFLASNLLTNFSLPATLTNLTELELSENPLIHCLLPEGLSNLKTLSIEFCPLPQFTLPGGLTQLTELNLGVNALTSFTVPADATNLAGLRLFFNQLTNLTLPQGLTRLEALDLDGNRLTHLTLPSDLKSLGDLLLRNNKLTDFVLPAGLGKLSFLGLDDNQLTQFTFPAGLTNLASVGLTRNLLTSLTLPPDLTRLLFLFVDGNPLTRLVLSEPLAASNLAETVALLGSRGASIFTYPLAIHLNLAHQTASGAFEFTLTGPPGVYTVLFSTNLASWSELGAVTNELGSIAFTDGGAPLSPQKFYRLRSP